MVTSYKKLEQYFEKLADNYYLGCQLSIDSECHMFIMKSKKDTGRGTIEIHNDETISWFYTINTNTEKQRYIQEVDLTPDWFQIIYDNVLKINTVDQIKMS